MNGRDGLHARVHPQARLDGLLAHRHADAVLALADRPRVAQRAARDLLAARVEERVLRARARAGLREDVGVLALGVAALADPRDLLELAARLGLRGEVEAEAVDPEALRV